jgi:hypothetical protein
MNPHTMRIAVDFDATIVSVDRRYDDFTTPFEFLEGAQQGLYALKNYGHKLILWSTRSNLAIRRSHTLNPPFRTEGCPAWLTEHTKQINERRYEHMVSFVNSQLPGVFHFIDDGMQGKVLADLFIEDRAWSPNPAPIDWFDVMRTLTQPETLRLYLGPDWVYQNELLERRERFVQSERNEVHQ